MARSKSTAEPPNIEAEGSVELEHTIRLRAYEISQSGDAGTPEENWLRAEQEIGVEG
jgi:Protein of unknown function (DUF2934)